MYDPLQKNPLSDAGYWANVCDCHTVWRKVDSFSNFDFLLVQKSGRVPALAMVTSLPYKRSMYILFTLSYASTYILRSDSWIKYDKMRCFVMFVTTVCVLFLLKLKWPKNKSFYNSSRFSWDVRHCAFNSIQVIQENSDWSCVTFACDKRAQSQSSLYGVVTTGPSTRGSSRGSRTKTHWLYVTGKPEIHKLLFLSYKWSLSGVFSVMKWVLWSSIPPSISKHLASRPWKTRYPGPERMISSRIPLIIFFVSCIPPWF